MEKIFLRQKINFVQNGSSCSVFSNHTLRQRGDSAGCSGAVGGGMGQRST